MAGIQRSLLNLDFTSRATRAGMIALVGLLSCWLVSGCSFDRDMVLGQHGYLENAHSETPRDQKSNPSDRSTHEQTAASQQNPKQSLQKDQPLRESPRDQIERAGTNQSQFSNGSNGPKRYDLPSAAQVEYLEAMTNAGITDPVERAEILATLETTDPMMRSMLFKMLRSQRTERRSESKTAQNGISDTKLAQKNQSSSEAKSQFANRQKTDYDPYTANQKQANQIKYEQTPLGPKVAMHTEPEDDQETDSNQQNGKFNPLRSSENYSGRQVPGKPNTRDTRSSIAQKSSSRNVKQVGYMEDQIDDDANAYTKTKSSQRNRLTAEPKPDDTEIEELLSQTEKELTGLSNPSSLGTSASSSAAKDPLSQQIRLRLLYALAGKKEQALEPVEGITRTQQDFLSQQVFGLMAMMPNERNLSFSRRASIASEHLRSAAEHLGQSGGLQVKNPNLCTEIKGFGDYKNFETDSFKAGQEVLIYAELDNFRSEQTAQGYHTRFTSRYQIIDSKGQRVDEQELKQVSEHCHNRRRDYFVSYHINFPAVMNPGEYTLKLIVEDLSSGLFGENSLQFQVGQSQVPLPTVRR